MACFRSLNLTSFFAHNTVFHHAQGHVHPKSPRAQISHFRYLLKNSMDFCSIEHCMMAVGIIGELTPSFRSRIGHDDDQICNIHHFAPLIPPSWRGVRMVKMSYLLTMSGDSSSETCLGVVSHIIYEIRTSFRIGIARHGQQI